MSISFRSLATATAYNNLPVMFLMHNGGFVGWSSTDTFFGPDLLIEKDVILVTAEYRLGIMGFLTLPHANYTGNNGLKDQQMALEWTYNNIGRFNGDKNRITIFGGGCKSLHYI